MIDRLYIPQPYNRIVPLCCDDHMTTNYNHDSYPPDIISFQVDIRYVIMIMILVVTDETGLMYGISGIMFTLSYLQYFSYVKKHNCNFDKGVLMSLFVGIWLCIYFGITDSNSFMPPTSMISYLMLVLSSCISASTISG